MDNDVATMARCEMVRGQRLPSAEVLKQFIDNGETYKQIGDRYGVTAEAVRIAVKRAGVTLPRQRIDHSKYVPWRLRADHSNDTIVRMLRTLSTLEQGGEVRGDMKDKIHGWVQFMNGGNPWGVPLSVHYSRNDPDGFWLAPRQPGDRNFIHPPQESRNR